MSSNDDGVSKNGKRYFTLNYDNLTETNLKDMVAGFKRNKVPVDSINASNRAKRLNGESVKTAQFIFENGQSLTISVGAGGDIVGTKLNARVMPISNLDTVSAYTREVADLVIANIPRYNKVLERKAKAAIKDASSVRPASRSIAARIGEAKVALIAAQEQLAIAETDKVEVSGQLDAVKVATSDYKSQIDALRLEEAELIKQITALGGEI